MRKKTQGIYELVTEALESISKPYGEDVIEDVLLAIEEQPNWLEKYNKLVQELSENEVNRRIGRYTKEITGLETLSEGVDAKRSKIAGKYTKLRS